MNIMKRCSKCKKEKPLLNFISKTGRDLKMCYDCRYDHECECGFRTNTRLNFQRHAWIDHGISFEPDRVDLTE